MAPAIVRRAPSGEQIHRLARTVSSTVSSLSNRAADLSEPPLVSIFALVIGRTNVISKRAASVLSETLHLSSEAGIAAAPISLSKRQNAILAIPTTYQGLNAGPQPGAIVGIMLGSIAGFILCLYILLFSFQFYGGRRKTVVEEEVIVHRRDRSRSRSRHTVMTERPPSPPRAAPPRRSSRRETIVIEERVHVPPRRPSEPPAPHRSRTPSLDEVIVEEEESVTEEIVEVIEEESSISSHRPPPKKPSPPRSPARRESRRSGYRTVDPAEFGGGDAPMRRVKKR